MFLAWLTIYGICGLGVAVYINKDGEFRPIETSGYMVASIFLWPFVLPAWLVSRPPSQLKDLGFEKSTAHYKEWRKTHKTRDIGDFSHWDKKGNDEESSDKEYNGDVSGKTSPDNPYVIGSGNNKNHNFSDNGFSEDSAYSGLSYNDISTPRKVYNPFQNDNSDSLTGENKPKFKRVNKKSQSAPKSEVPSIADILDDSGIAARKVANSGKAFSDHNVRKLIDDGRLRDAYRVARRMLKVSQELGEEHRTKAYTRYLSEIENRLKAERKEQEK